MQEPTIRVLMGRLNPSGLPITVLVSLPQSADLSTKGWMFVAADPDDLNTYLTWLYQRETDTL